MAIDGNQFKKNESWLSYCQDRPFRENDKAVKIPDGIKLPVFVKDILSYGPKHPIRHNFFETHFLAELNKLMSSKRDNGVCSEIIRQVEASAKRSAKILRETPVHRRLSRVTNYLKENDFLAVSI